MDAEFKRIQKIAGKRSLIAILANLPMIGFLAWLFLSHDEVADAIGRTQWLLEVILLSLIALEGWLWYWIFGALINYTRTKASKQ